MTRYLPLLLCAAALSAHAAPVATPINPIPDLNQDQIRQSNDEAEQRQNKTAAPVSMTSQELLQRPDLLQNALDTAISQQNIKAVRFLLPLWKQLPEDKRDPVLGEYADALLMRADGHQAEASVKLRALLAAHPEYAPIRLDLAQTLSQDGQEKEAAQEIAKIRETPDLPQPVTEYLNQFDAHLKRSRSWQLGANAYYLQEKNVGRVPEQRTYGPWRFSEPKSAHGIGYELNAQKTTPVSGHWATRVNLSAYGKFYWDAHDYDDLILHAEGGPVWRNAKNEVSLTPLLEKRWYSGDSFSNSSGAALRYSHIFSPKWQLFSAWQSDYKRHNKRVFLDGSNHSGSLTLLYRSSPQQYFVLGTGGGRSNAKDLSDAYSFGSLRAGWTRDWGKSRALTTSLNASVQRRNYRAPDFFNIKRRDTEYFTRLSLSHSKASWKGFTPRLNWTWSHVSSNHFYYRYNQNRVFLDVQKQFR